MGVGNFFGMLPEEMRNSRLYRKKKYTGALDRSQAS